MIQTLIVSLSAWGVGLVSYLGVGNVRQAYHSRGGERRLNIAYAVARAGFVVVVALITEAVFNAPVIPFTWRVGIYILGLVMVVAGYLGVAFEGRRLTGQRAERDARGPDDPRDARDPRRRGDIRDERDERLPGDPRDPRDSE